MLSGALLVYTVLRCDVLRCLNCYHVWVPRSPYLQLLQAKLADMYALIECTAVELGSQPFPFCYCLQLVQGKLADMYAVTQATRAFVYATARAGEFHPACPAWLALQNKRSLHGARNPI